MCVPYPIFRYRCVAVRFVPRRRPCCRDSCVIAVADARAAATDVVLCGSVSGARRVSARAFALACVQFYSRRPHYRRPQSGRETVYGQYCTHCSRVARRRSKIDVFPRLQTAVFCFFFSRATTPCSYPSERESVRTQSARKPARVPSSPSRVSLTVCRVFYELRLLIGTRGSPVPPRADFFHLIRPIAIGTL